ncbi:hypothetical protein IAI10_16650 [Clostridium sp. 19966]|uniref:hypothetical protein n=1 Tax=Clostridium sp. 19966 TaxID=2768166 RepID=UPI0028DFDE91|nr:hypothetical protein [Clostridium sp. 19966]MDT8718299.1 hypothetical protein [Clostridium sp. 19966]
MSYVVYIYRNDMRYSPGLYIDEIDIKNLCRIIARASKVPKIVICDSLDNIVLQTMANYIDICDENLLEKLLPIVIEYQNGKKDPYKEPIKYKYSGDLSKAEFEKWIYKEFNYTLDQVIKTKEGDI